MEDFSKEKVQSFGCGELSKEPRERRNGVEEKTWEEPSTSSNKSKKKKSLKTTRGQKQAWANNTASLQVKSMMLNRLNFADTFMLNTIMGAQIINNTEFGNFILSQTKLMLQQRTTAPWHFTPDGLSHTEENSHTCCCKLILIPKCFFLQAKWPCNCYFPSVIEINQKLLTAHRNLCLHVLSSCQCTIKTMYISRDTARRNTSKNSE